MKIWPWNSLSAQLPGISQQIITLDHHKRLHDFLSVCGCPTFPLQHSLLCTGAECSENLECLLLENNYKSTISKYKDTHVQPAAVIQNEFASLWALQGYPQQINQAQKGHVVWFWSFQCEAAHTGSDLSRHTWKSRTSTNTASITLQASLLLPKGLWENTLNLQIPECREEKVTATLCHYLQWGESGFAFFTALICAEVQVMWTVMDTGNVQDTARSK